MRESEQIAAQRVALGRRLASHRERNGLSQQELAKRLFRDRTSIAKIETGQQGAPQPFWREADSLLGAGGELVAGFDALTAAKAANGQTHTHVAARRGEASADVLAGLLAAATLPVARASDKVKSASVDPAQVNAVIELEALTRAVSEHNRRVLMGQPADWAEISDRLRAAATACQRHAVIEPLQDMAVRCH